MAQSFESVVDTIFSGGLDDYKPLDSIHNYVVMNAQARGLLACVLQHDGEDDDTQDGF